MKKILVLFILCFAVASWGFAKKGAHKAVKEGGEGLKAEAIGASGEANAPAVAVEPSEVTLKDGQSVKGQIQGYDSYFLDIKSYKGATFHIPWPEVQAMSRQGTPEEWAQAYMTPEKNVAVSTIVTPISGAKAFKASLFPGILVHGWGHMQARDSDRFYALLGAEVFGLMVGTFGVTEMRGPIFFKPNNDNPGENDDTARALAWGGITVFTLSWLYDVAFASSAADRFNREHGLAMEMTPALNGVQLGMAYKF